MEGMESDLKTLKVWFGKTFLGCFRKRLFLWGKGATPVPSSPSQWYCINGWVRYDDTKLSPGFSLRRQADLLVARTCFRLFVAHNYDAKVS